ncbi:hypothetical protein G6F68_019740 [Rhizopus microsporus]|nr:hypothetical protein G6F68_019740 [Rhizopus microsporus]
MAIDPPLTLSLVDALFRQTSTFWLNWVSESTYKGRWREHVLRSALVLKLLTYEPTGAVVASPTFGFPEENQPLEVRVIGIIGLHGFVIPHLRYMPSLD